MELKEKKLLITASSYPSKDGKIPAFTFVKNRVDALRYYFKKIIVIAPTGYFPNFLAKHRNIT